MVQIQIKGPIVSDGDRWFYDWMDMPATAPKDIILPEGNEPVEVIINSGGGDAYAGSEIYTALKSYAGPVTVKVVGIAASAASVIAMAGDVVEISPTAQLMIHNVWTTVSGDNRALLKEGQVLEGYNRSIANSYLLKTGLEMGELLELMNQETWFTAEAAVERGFADKVMFVEEVAMAPQLVAGVSELIPSDFIAKMANLVNREPVVDYDKISRMVAERLASQKTEAASDVKQVPRGFGAFCF